MGGVLVDSDQFSFADGDTGKVLDLGGAPSVGQWDILCVNSNTTVDTPTGFTALETSVHNQGSYVFGREAAGGEGSTVTVNTTGNHATNVMWQRWGNLDVVDTSTNTFADGSSGNSTPAHSTGTLADNDEVSIAFAALHSIGTANQSSPVYPTGYDQGQATAVQGSGATGVRGYIASKIGAGTAAETPQFSWSGDGCQNRYILVVTFLVTGTEVAITAASALGVLTGTGTIVRSVGVSAAASLSALAAEARFVVPMPERVANSAGWYQLLNIWQEAKQIVMDDAAEPPTACPNDGEPLLTAPDGQLFCPWDGWPNE